MKVNVFLCFAAAILLMVQAAAQVQVYTGTADPAGTLSVVEKPIQDFSHKYLPPSGREGGEDFASAIPIASLPFTDLGNTCDNVDNYDVICPYDASGSPDVVYSYTALANGVLNVSLCNDATDYDSKLHVYENNPGSLVGCNDDFCVTASYPIYPFVSHVASVPMTTGNTYYIIVDGYGGDCGTYEILVELAPYCPDCFSCSVPEGEGDIPAYGTDTFNGGCNSIPNVFSPITLNQVVCGLTNTYLPGYRDTDWYEITLTEAGTLYWSGFAGYPLEIYILSGECPTTVFAAGLASGCTTTTISVPLPAGTYYLVATIESGYSMAIGQNYNVVATLNAPPPADWCTLPPPVETPVSNWALFLALGLIGMLVIFRIWKKM